MACFLCFPLLCNRDNRYPQCFQQQRCQQQRNNGCSMEACERISHIFYVLLALFAWNLDNNFLSPLFWQPLPLCAATVHGSFWANFVYFLREKWTRITTTVHTWKFEHYFYELYLAHNTACVSLRSFWKNFTYFQRVGGLGFPRAVRT